MFSPHSAWTCASCGDTGDFLFKDKAGALCLDCADLGHLEFLPSGDAALTRRATKASRLSAVVVRWSRRRNRYERQGILAEAVAIEHAAQECLSDADVRARCRTRDQSRRADQDVVFRSEFAAAIREQFPGCPVDRAEAIALHAAARGSGRVGRSAAGRALDSDAVRLAVVASVRHSTPTTTPCSCRVSTANRLEHKCTTVSRTSSMPGATVLRCSANNAAWRPDIRRCTRRGDVIRLPDSFPADDDTSLLSQRSPVNCSRAPWCRDCGIASDTAFRQASCLRPGC